MKRFFKHGWIILCTLAVLCFSCAYAEETADAPVFVLPVDSAYVELHTETIDEELWLFLPAFAQLEDLRAEGAELEWWDMEADEEGLWYVDLLLNEEETLMVNVMRSENLRSLFLFSDDPVNQGRDYIQSTENKHENFTTASMVLIGEQGELDHAEAIRKLRGRGNWSWGWPKQSYQIKLENRTDLLDTGNDENRARNWLLMGEGLDATLLHNRITQDLALELGLTGLESEFIDLYYDGEYCGTYLLCEKVEIGEGRIDEMDYDSLLQKWNNKVGQYDLETLAAGKGENRFGNFFTYIEGVVEDARPDLGAYLVEMESPKLTLSDRCYFRLRDSEEPVYALKNPENASENMVRYISQRLQEAQDTLKAGGVNPETGRTAAEDFDLDAFARALLLQELSYNVDGYTYSSSYFVLPAGESRFEPGPVWDFDLSYRYYYDGRNAGAIGFKDESGWPVDFYAVPAFREIAKQVYQEELYPLITDVLLGGQNGRYLQPLECYVENIRASAAMSEKLWGRVREGRFRYWNNYEDEIWMLRDFIDRRSQWLYTAVQDLQADENNIALWMDVKYTEAEESPRFFAAPWQQVSAQLVSAWQVSEATEENYACWQLEAVVRAADGRTLEDCSVTLNGTPVSAQLQQDGTLLICAQYEDESYRPVDYYGEDVGLVYSYEYYISRYPDAAQACDYDEETVMNYFFDEGIYEGQAGNAFFFPEEIALRQPYVQEMFYDDWSMYYWEFLTWGVESGWLSENVERFVPAVAAVP